jgi:hypothetical protein
MNRKGKLTKTEREALSRALRALGSLGGKTTAKRMTAKQRTARARKAGKARQAKARAIKGGKR